MPRSEIFFLTSSEDISKDEEDKMLSSFDIYIDNDDDISIKKKENLKSSIRACAEGFNKYKSTFKNLKFELVIFYLSGENEIGIVIRPHKGPNSVNYFLSIQVEKLTTEQFEDGINNYSLKEIYKKINSK